VGEMSRIGPSGGGEKALDEQLGEKIPNGLRTPEGSDKVHRTDPMQSVRLVATDKEKDVFEREQVTPFREA
jgi:hypothetical protein